MTAPRFVFPDGFHWGAATSAYQIEGSPLADGAGPSIWQRFAHTPGMMANGDTGDVACDHYRRYREDVQLMKALGLHGYRFSINWARVLPEGTGRVNPKGLDFYSRLVDELLEHGIVPNATLFHWDLPAALDDRGGWLNRDSAHWFAEYAEVMFKALDDRVPRWSTLNEPWVVTDGGYLHGALAPGHRNKYEAPIVTHNLMRASGAGIQAYRAHGRHQIGVVFNIEPKYPYSEGAEDMAATARAHAYMNRQFADPALLGSYPEQLKEIFGEAWPDFPAEDFALTRQRVDFVGINYYTRAVVRHDADAYPLRAVSVRQPIGNLALSNVARTGLWAWAKTAAQDLRGSGITVNLACPGSHATDRMKELSGGHQEGMGDPADFGKVVAFLCSQPANFVSGIAMGVDGAAVAGLL